MSRFRELKKDTRLMSGIYILSLVTALLILALAVRGPERSGSFIADDEGRITGIKRDSLARAESYDLDLEAKDGDVEVERRISLNLRAGSNGSRARLSDAGSREAEISAGIDAVISEIEQSDKKLIKLPSALPDGTKLEWRASGETGDGSTILFIIVLYAGLVAAVVASKLRPDKGSAEERRSVMRGLPRFCNQLFLMMNAGLILSDAFDTIADSYSSYDEGDLSPFEKDISELNEASDGHRVSTAQLISEYAAKRDVKELIRISAILTENERRGSDVVESLERESRYLWDERKIVARESGRMIDTKMSYPLGMLLILLIVITMAPALLNM